jgi:hypothetical protein
VLETHAFFRAPDFARSRFERYGDVFETSLLGQRTVASCWGPLSLANRNGADHAKGLIRRIWRSSGSGERVCLGKALAKLEIRLLAVGLLQQLILALEADQDLTLKVIPSPSPADGLLVRTYSRAS